MGGGGVPCFCHIKHLTSEFYRTTEETLTEQCQRRLDTINKIEAVRVQKVEERKEYLASRYEWEMIILIRKYFHGFDPMEPLTTCEKMLPTFPGEGRPLVRYVRPDIRPDVRPDGRRDARQDKKRRLLLARYRRQEELRLKELEKLSSKEADELRLKKLRLKKEKERECQELLDQNKRKKAANAADLEKYRERALKKVKMYKKGLVEWFFYGVEPAEPWTTCAEMIPKDPPDEYEGYEYDEDELKAYFDLDDNWKTRKYNTTK